MAEQFDGRVLVTTTAKAQAVKSLLEYWTMKTDLLKKRANPASFASEEAQQKTLNYMLKNTKIAEDPFWHALDGKSQKKAMKCFTMHEVPKPKKEIISKKRLKAAMYICLSGTATVKNMTNGKSSKYSAGQVFGATDLFSKVIVDGEELVDEHPDDNGLPDSMIEFGEGTFMRMELLDLYNTVFRPDELEVERQAAIKEMEQAVKISGIAWNKMSEDDKFYVRVYKRTKELVNPQFFSFIDAYRMVPKNAQMASYKYYNEGYQGREMYLDMRDQPWVFIFIDGSVRYELYTPKSTGGDHTVTCVQTQTASSKDAAMHIKTRSMPLMLLSAGSVMCIQPECFTLADPQEQPDPDSFEAIVSPTTKPPSASPPPHATAGTKNQGGKGVLSKFRSKFPHHKLPNAAATSHHNNHVRRGSDSSIDTFATNRTAHTVATFNTANTSLDSRMHRKSDHFVPSSTPPDVKDAQYHIRMVFQAHTTFLAVPYTNFERILDDSKLVMPKIAKEIKWYLSSPNDLIKERISRLLPWVQGNIDFNKKELPPKIVKSLGFLLNDPGPKLDETAIPLGSFAPCHTEQDENNSFRMSLSSPQLSAPRPDSDGFTSHSERLSHSRGLSGKSGKVGVPVAPRQPTVQDATMSHMLAQLRSDNTASSHASSSKRQSRKHMMFMTQEGATGEAGMSLTEGDFEDDDDSDSDVSLSDFKQPRAAAKTKTPPSAAGRASAAQHSAKQRLRGHFSDSFQDEIEPGVSKVASGEMDAVLGNDVDKEMSTTSEDVQSTHQVLSVMAIDSAQTSFITSNPHDGKEEAALQLQSSKCVSDIIS